jgi:glycosyltransferase involved in cell wall biosynthesis
MTISTITTAKPARVGIVCDFPEENWPSMDLTGEMVLAHLAGGHAGEFAAGRICPPFQERLARLPILGRKGAARNVDRLMNRFWDYPRALGRVAVENGFDLYHLVDHSYSQLVHVLPPGRAVVTCHDLDTFRCLLEPEHEPRPAWFRLMARRILSGLRKAAAVSCDSEATRDALLAHGLMPADRLHVVYLGTHPECSPDPDPAADAEAARLLGPPHAGPDAPPDLLHVGSNIPRKRVDVLLDVFAAVRRAMPGARLIKVGGALPLELDRQARALGVADAILTLPFFSPRQSRDRAALAAVYRRASLVLQPSRAEGFGLPVAEALACGVPLLASDIAVLREVGGAAALYRPVGDVPAWTAAALAMLDDRKRSADAWLNRRAEGLARARLYSWSTHAARLATIYREVLSRPELTPSRPDR